MESKPILLITGISGYLGAHVCKQALDSGKYKVRGTVRDKTATKKLEPLIKAFGEMYNDIELVNLHLDNKEEIEEAVNGSTYIIHVASPFLLESPKDEEKECIQPAIDGNLYLLEA